MPARPLIADCQLDIFRASANKTREASVNSFNLDMLRTCANKTCEASVNSSNLAPLPFIWIVSCVRDLISR